MNCNCVPPKPAVVKVSHTVKSSGKEFFSCSSNTCGFFAWAGEYIPMSLAFGRNRPNNPAKPTNAHANSSSSPQKVNGKHEAKIMLHEISGPPVEIWLSLLCPTTPVVNDLFTRLPQDKCKFSNSLKMWLFTYSLYEKVVTEFLTPPFENMRLTELPRFLSKGLGSYQKKVNKLNAGPELVLNLTPKVNATLLPFQLEAVRFVARRGGRALLGDDMGCGKTLQAIACMLHFRQFWPVLIVVPSSLLKQWPDEIQKYAGDVVKPSDVRIVGKSTDISTGMITIITYKVMDNLVGNKLLTPDQFGVVIADESHNLKNKDTSRSGAVLPFLKKANVAICMTGTPAVNRPVELFSQLSGILPDVFNDYNQFTARYCDAKPNRNMPGLNVSGSSNEQELNMLLTGLVMIRRTKAEVLSSLPEKRRELRYVDPDPECLPEIRRINARSKKLDEQLANPAGRDNAELQAMSNEKQQLLTALYTVTGTSKIASIREELVKLIEESRRERGIVVAAEEKAQRDGKESDSEGTVELDEDVVHRIESGGNKGKRGGGQAASSSRRGAPVILEIEDDIVTGKDFVHDLCESDDEEQGHHRAQQAGQRVQGASSSSAAAHTRKRPREQTNRGGFDDEAEDSDDASFATCPNYSSSSGDEHEDGADESTYNIRDIKAGRAKTKKADDRKAAANPTHRDTAEVFSLFDLHKAKKKGASKGAGKKAAAGSANKEEDASSDRGSSTSDGAGSAAATKAKSVGQKIIVFFHHKAVLSAIEESLLQMQVKFIKIDGTTTQARRAKLIDQFQNDDVTDVALLSITACGVGLNLTRANVALFGELNWSLGVVLQAEDRIHRLGQIAKEVRIIYIIARNTLDEIVWEQIQRKHQVVGATVGTSDNRSYGGGMKINSSREHGQERKQQQAGMHTYAESAVEKEGDVEAVMAGFAAYANHSAAASSSSAPPVPPVPSREQLHPQPQIHAAQRPPGAGGNPFQANGVPSGAVPPQVPACYLVPPASTGIPPRVPPVNAGGPAQIPACYLVPPVYTVPHNAAPVAAPQRPAEAPSLYRAASLPAVPPLQMPRSFAPPAPVPAAPAALYNRNEEFAYSASTDASDSQGLPAPAPRTGPVGPSYTGNPFSAPSTIGQQPPLPPPPVPPVQIQVPPTAAAPNQQAATKSGLAPEVLARIEANRLAAQAKLAAAKQRAELTAAVLPASEGLAQTRSLPTTSTVPQLHVSIAAPAAVTVPPRFPATAASPSNLHSALHVRAASVNEPPGPVKASPEKSLLAGTAPAAAAPGHMFSTGKGTTVSVSDASMQRAENILGCAAFPAVAPAAITHAAIPPGNPFAHAASAPTPAPAPIPAYPAPQLTAPYGVHAIATLYFTGGSLENPGKSGAGYQLFANNGRTIKESAVRINAQATNNQAEYVGLIHGLTAALHCGVQELSVYGDSEVVIKQMLGQYQVKNPVLVGMNQRAQSLRQRFRRVQFQWVPKDKNSGAHAQAKKAVHQSEQCSEAADWFTA